jgi:molybdenum cofactor cytidylyltransferase
VLPVDFPLVRAETVRLLVHSFATHPAPIVRPLFDGTPGHPTLFARELFTELQTTHPSGGARGVVEHHAPSIRDIVVYDAGVTIDIDTPEDYQRHVQNQ